MATSCNKGYPCFICIGRKIKCTYSETATPAPKRLTAPKKQLTSAEIAAGAGSRAGSPAYEESNAENSNVEEAKQALLRKEVAAMTEASKLNNKNSKNNKKRKSRKATRAQHKGTRKFKHK
jgi:hypothetical protein